MGRRTRYEPGTFCWVDLATNDVDGAIAFYECVLRWQVGEAMAGGYRIARHDGAIVAGIAELPADAGLVPAWQTYVSVEDAQAAAQRAGELGGTVVAGPTAMPGAATMAVIRDPQGAQLMLWQPDGFAGAELVNTVGAWVWSDLQTTDPDGAATFYTDLLGWEIDAVPGAGGQYSTIRDAGRAIGGLMPAPPGVPHPVWTVYFGVESAAAALEHVEAAGGRRLTEPMEVPAGRFAVAADPAGAAFCVFDGQFDD